MAQLSEIIMLLNQMQERRESRKDREEDRAQEMLQYLMTLGESEKRLALDKKKYADELVMAVGSKNIINDPVSGVPRIKTSGEGFSIKDTPEWELFSMKHEKESEIELNKSILIDAKEAYREKKAERDSVWNALDQKYIGLPSELKTAAFSDLIVTLSDADTNTYIGNLESNIDTLNQNILEVENIESILDSSILWYHENVDEYVGGNKKIQPHEFESMITDFLVEHPEATYKIKSDDPNTPDIDESEYLELTQALRQVYLEKKPSSDDIAMANIKWSTEADNNAKAYFGTIKSFVADEDFDLDAFGENEEVQKWAIEAINMADYNDFFQYINAPEGESVKNAIWDAFPLQMEYLEKHYLSRKSLISESHDYNTEGFINDLLVDFEKDLNAIDDKSAAFELYRTIEQQLPADIDIANSFFTQIESKFDSDDLYDEYLAHLGSPISYQAANVEKVGESLAQHDDILYTKYTKDGVVDVDLIYKDLNQVYAPIFYSAFSPSEDRLIKHGAEQSNYVPGIRTNVRHANKSGKIYRPFKSYFGGLKEQKPNYTLATALFSDSSMPYGYNNYYDAMYTSIRNQVKDFIVTGPNIPWTVDKTYYAERFVTDTELNELILTDPVFGETQEERTELFMQIFTIASAEAEAAQKQKITQILKNPDEDPDQYADLLTALNFRAGYDPTVPSLGMTKHVMGEGGVYDVDEYQYPVPGGVTIDDVLMGDTGLPFQLPWNEIYEGGAGGEWLYSRYNIAQDDASLNLYDLNTNFYGPYSSTGTIIDYEKYIKPVDE